MSIDPKKFGLSDSLVNAVNEALKGGQVKLDKNHNGKLDSDDFKKLRGEQSPGDYEKANYKHDMLGTDKKMKNEVADGNKANFKQNMKEDDNKPATKIVAKPQYDKTRPAFTEPKKKVNEDIEQIDELSPATLSSYKAKAAGSETSLTNKSSTLSVPPKDRNAAAVKANQRRIGMKLATKKIGEEAVAEAAPMPTPGSDVSSQIAARKMEIQQKIAQKQATHQQSKANKRISGSPMKEAKCTCGESKSSKMTCEVCNSENKSLKGGKEPIVMNPPLKEASNLPKAVVSKGHEIAKSLIKHRSKVKEPYAVGMAQAKKSAGIKEDAEQVDELSKETMKSYVKAVDKRGEGVKRGTGLNTASQKIAKQEPTSTLKKTVDAIKNTPHGKMKSSSVYKFGASHAELQKRDAKKTKY